MSPLWNWLTETPTPISWALLVIGLMILFRPQRLLQRYKSPVSSKDKTEQWLLAHAEKQRDNPASYLVATDRILFDFNRDARRPRLHMRLYYVNRGVYDLVVSQPEGYPFYQGEQLPDLITDRGVKNNVPAGDGNLLIDLDVFIPEQFMVAVCQELDTGAGEVRQLGLNDLSCKVWIKGDDSREHRLGLGSDRMIIRPNR